MSMDRGRRPFLAAILLVGVLGACVVAYVGTVRARAPSAPSEAIRGRRVVLVTLPGVTWRDVRTGRTPVLDRLVAEGSTAAMAPRSASVRASAVRGYLTLGAGNRAAAAHDSSVAQRAYETDEEVNAGVTADSALTSVAGQHRDGDIVHLGTPELFVRQGAEYHGTHVGALGEALARAGIDRGIVSAADRAPEGRPSETGRGAPVLAVVDHDGVVPRGRIRGLVELAETPGVPFGVRTRSDAFERAVDRMLGEARFLLVEPGETLRADELAGDAFPERALQLRREALERADALVGRVVRSLGDDDLLLVVAPSSASSDPQEHLTPMIAWGSGIEPGLLESATTRRPGLVTLTDVAPTVLDAFGVERPSAMSGRAMRVVPVSDVARPQLHDELDARSVFREKFVPSVFYTFVALFVVVSILVGLVFLGRLPLAVPLVAMCYVVLAVPLATFLVSVVPLWKAGIPAAHVAVWSIALVVAGAGWVVPGPRWVGAIPILAATSAFIATVLVAGGDLLVNAVFGNSVLAAGRFYGIPNTGSALFFGATVLMLAALAELWPVLGSRIVVGGGLIVLLALTGLPPFGADVGGLLTGVAAAAVIVLVARERTVPWRVVAIALIAAVAATLLVAFADSLRPAAEQTHLGRFGEAVFGGDRTAFGVVTRKAAQSWASLSFSRFTYVIPLGIAALAVLLRRPRGPLRDTLRTYPAFRAALAGLLVAGVLGFALNDSGVAVPAMLLAQAVPLVVLLGVDDLRLRANDERLL